ncbi:hypothetical protein FPV67DRAFT_1444432 [Lyophyllum atratum]|nr:hypothetical protein FPV67DRAFT_1444432 [Lyophyllum atratum]
MNPCIIKSIHQTYCGDTNEEATGITTASDPLELQKHSPSSPEHLVKSNDTTLLGSARPSVTLDAQPIETSFPPSSSTTSEPVVTAASSNSVEAISGIIPVQDSVEPISNIIPVQDSVEPMSGVIPVRPADTSIATASTSTSHRALQSISNTLEASTSEIPENPNPPLLTRPLITSRVTRSSKRMEEEFAAALEHIPPRHRRPMKKAHRKDFMSAVEPTPIRPRQTPLTIKLPPRLQLADASNTGGAAAENSKKALVRVSSLKRKRSSTVVLEGEAPTRPRRSSRTRSLRPQGS